MPLCTSHPPKCAGVKCPSLTAKAVWLPACSTGVLQTSTAAGCLSRNQIMQALARAARVTHERPCQECLPPCNGPRCLACSQGLQAMLCPQLTGNMLLQGA